MYISLQLSAFFACKKHGKVIYLRPSSKRDKNYCSRQHLGFANAVRKGAKINQVHDEMKSIIWSREIAYLVGLIATDGTLRKNRKQIKFTNKDRQIMNNVKKIVLSITGREYEINEIYPKLNGKTYKHYQIQFTSYPFYDFSLQIGITPNKTYSIGKLSIPDNYFADFLRGVIDGDGNYNYQNTSEIIMIRIHSASEIFLEWLNEKTIKIFGISGGWIDYYENELGGKYILFFQSGYDVVRIFENIYYPGAYLCVRKKRKAKYMLSNNNELKKRFQKKRKGKLITCSIPNCNNKFIAVTYNHLYCEEHKR